MSELTLHMGGQGSCTTINIDWFDENNIRQSTEIDIVIQAKDKPRTLEVRVRGVKIAEVPASFGIDAKEFEKRVRRVLESELGVHI